MQFRKNVVSLGTARAYSARGVSGQESTVSGTSGSGQIQGGAGADTSDSGAGDAITQFFMAGEGAIVRKVFDERTRSLKTDPAPISHASGYLKLTNGAIEDIGELIYAKT